MCVRGKRWSCIHVPNRCRTIIMRVSDGIEPMCMFGLPSLPCFASVLFVSFLFVYVSFCFFYFLFLVSFLRFSFVLLCSLRVVSFLFCSALPFVVMEDLSIWMSSEFCAACSVTAIMSCCSYAVLCAVCMQLDAGLLYYRYALVLWCALRRVWHFSAVRYAAWLCCAVLCYVCVCVVFQCA